MNHTMRPALVLVLCSLAAASALGQGVPAATNVSAPVPTNLDEMIATALRTSPEVLLAEAKLRQAQAELNQTRLKVTRDVVGAFNEKKQRQTALVGAERQLGMTTKSAAAGTSSTTEVDAARHRLGEAELAIAQADADIRYLLGVGSQLDPAQVRDPFTSEKAKRRPARPDRAPDALVEPLEKPVSVQFQKANIEDVFKALSSQANVSIVIDPNGGIEPGWHPVTLTLTGPVTLAAVLQALADQYDVCFVLRDYGVLATTEERARSIPGHSIPDLPLDPK